MTAISDASGESLESVRIFCSLLRGVKDEVSAILPAHLGSTVNQTAHFRLDAQVEGVAFGDKCACSHEWKPP